MRVVVTGYNGQLGHDVVAELLRRGADATGVDIDDMDITDAAAVDAFLSAAKPDAVVHCAAFTAVDAAERDAARCEKVNVTGTANIAAAADRLDAVMVYLSTDYVFKGQGENEWEPDDPVCPQSVYGRTKRAGELEVMKRLTRYYIVRTSWVFGENGSNFVRTMLRLGRERGSVGVVCDQIGSPTYTGDLAALLCDMLETDRYGVYHATNEGFCSWYEFACEIFRQAGLAVEVAPLTTEQYSAAAARPKNSRLSKKKLDANGFGRLPDWRDALGRYLKNMGELNG